MLPFEQDIEDEIGRVIKIDNPEDGFEESLCIDYISFESGEFHAEIVVTKEWQEEMSAIHGKAELIIGKQRHGPVGTIELAFDGRYTRFGNLAKSYENKPQ